MAYEDQLYADFVQLARFANRMGGHEATPLLRGMARRYRDLLPELSHELIAILRTTSTRQAGTATTIGVPVDSGSRLALVREEDPVVLQTAPILDLSVGASLAQLIDEHTEPDRLVEAGLTPTRTVLFTGPPGVGKTLAARWIAHSLRRPLIVLDLASVMSSLLGKTGENLRRVLEYAKQTPAVLLIDELDAVAKRRDDVGEVGELKRLVTVLLQEIDMWPEGSLLISATNHPDLLDPAVWRRFELTIDFPLPNDAQIKEAVTQYLDGEAVTPATLNFLSAVFRGGSYSDVEREVMRARRLAAVSRQPTDRCLLEASMARTRELPSAERIRLAQTLTVEGNLSQRRVHELTGVSRDTLRKYAS